MTPERLWYDWRAADGRLRLVDEVMRSDMEGKEYVITECPDDFSRAYTYFTVVHISRFPGALVQAECLADGKPFTLTANPGRFEKEHWTLFLENEKPPLKGVQFKKLTLHDGKMLTVRTPDWLLLF